MAFLGGQKSFGVTMRSKGQNRVHFQRRNYEDVVLCISVAEIQ